MTSTVVRASRAEAAQIVADRIELLLERDAPVLGVATGSSPLAVYAELARRRTSAEGDTARLRTEHVRLFALDEYVGLPSRHAQSYRETLIREVCRPLGISTDRLHTPPSGIDGLDLCAAAVAAEAYESAIDAAGGIDLQLLGIGGNGHVAFNEPGSTADTRTRLVRLDERTRRDNARFFDAPDAVPEWCMTQGIATILRAKELVLLAFGSDKAQALAAMLTGEPTARLPASLLCTHPRLTVFADDDALAHVRSR